MKLAVVSDIHSNLEAFEAVLADASTLGVDQIVSLGDNIGYGGDPEAVFRLMGQHKIESVMGNHELALMDGSYLEKFNPRARKALLINKSLISRETMDQILLFQPFMVRFGLRFVHGLPPDSVTTYLSKVSISRLVHIMASMDEKITFVGHTHKLSITSLFQGRVTQDEMEKKVLFLDKRARYIINAGSVGQPRSSNLDAKYLVFDSSLYSIAPRYVAYDKNAAAEKIRKAGIPGAFAQILVGR